MIRLMTCHSDMRRLVIIVAAMLLFQASAKEQVITLNPKVSSQVDRTVLNWKNVEYWLFHYEVKGVPAALKKIKLEVGDLNSGICLKNGNLFGMKKAKRRKHSASGERRGYAKYAHWRLSILDYKLWQVDRELRGLVGNNGYAEDPLYEAKLKRINVKISDRAISR